VIRKSVSLAQHGTVSKEREKRLDVILKKLAQYTKESKAYFHSKPPRKIFKRIEMNLESGRIIDLKTKHLDAACHRTARTLAYGGQ
jgi:hypothetical protein